MRARPGLFLGWAAAVLLGPPFFAQVAHQHHPPTTANEYIRVLEDPGRDEWQRPEEVVNKLDLRPGENVADIGSGSGYFTVRFARAVGPTGKVFAVDIDREMLAYVARRAKEEHLGNIYPVQADAQDPGLEPSSIDLIFICDTLHHISDRAAYFPLLARALKPGGRLVNIDFEKRELPLGPPLAMKIDKRDMIKEAEAGGFKLSQEFDFLKYQYFLVFTR
jgi:ubiquinone/menaquinone biosynthesis C-methylase UbiE